MNDEEMKVNLQQMLKESYRSYPPGRLLTFAEVQVDDTIRAEKSTGVVRVVRGKVISVAADFLPSGLLRLSNTGDCGGGQTSSVVELCAPCRIDRYERSLLPPDQWGRDGTPWDADDPTTSVGQGIAAEVRP